MNTPLEFKIASALLERVRVTPYSVTSEMYMGLYLSKAPSKYPEAIERHSKMIQYFLASELCRRIDSLEGDGASDRYRAAIFECTSAQLIFILNGYSHE
jgi:hypothetical protein